MNYKKVQVTKICEVTRNHHKVLINEETAAWIIRHKFGGDHWAIRDASLKMLYRKNGTALFTFKDAEIAVEEMEQLIGEADGTIPTAAAQAEPLNIDDWRPGDNVPGEPNQTVLEVEYKVWVQIERITIVDIGNGETDELYDDLNGGPISVGSFPTLEEARRAQSSTYVLGNV